MTNTTTRRPPSARDAFPPPSRRLSGTSISTIVGIGIAVLVALIPFYGLGFAFDFLAVYMVITCMLALSLHLLMGIAGLFSLGQAALFGTGAYAAVVVINDLKIDGAIGFFIVAAIGAVVGLIMGAVTLRVSDLYLALITLAVGFILDVVVRNSDFLRGVQGITGFTITFFGMPLVDPHLMLWVGLFFLYLLIVIITSIRRSKIGRALMATRESPIAARSIGVDPRRYKLLVFGIAGAFSAVAGGLYAAWSLVVAPTVFDIDLTLTVLAMAIVGGVRSLPGVIVVSVLLTYFRNSASQFGVQNYVLLIFGLLIVLALRFLPLGLGGLATSPRVLGAFRSLGARLSRKKDAK
jgi:branched-chain amino acid transport system permease protein